MIGPAVSLQEFGDFGEVGGLIDVEPGGAAGGGEAGGLAGGFGVGEGVWGGPADAVEHAGMGAMCGDGPVAAVVGGGEGDVRGGLKHGFEMSVGEGGGVRAEEEGGDAGGEGVEHAGSEVAGALEGLRNVWVGKVVCKDVQVQLSFRQQRQASEHRMDEELMEGGGGFGADSSGETSFDAARHRSLGEEQDDGTVGQIVE